MLVGDIMTRAIVALAPDNGVRHAAQLMLDHHVSGLPVVDDQGRLVGMLTEGDLLRRSELGASAKTDGRPQTSADFIKTHGWRVGDVMTTPAMTVSPTLSVARLAEMMADRQIKRLPVIDNGVLIGIVSRADILRGLVAAPRDTVASSDEGLLRAVATRLKFELDLDPALIEVTVHDANVHLAGQVRTDTDRRAVQLAAETVEGVRGVVNVLTLMTAPSPETKD